MKRDDIFELITLAVREGALTRGERNNVDRIAAELMAEIDAEKKAEAATAQAARQAAMEAAAAASKQKAADAANQPEEGAVPQTVDAVGAVVAEEGTNG